MQWIDLSRHGIALAPTKLPSGKMVLLALGPGVGEHTDKLRALGYQQIGSILINLKYSGPDGRLHGFIPRPYIEQFPEGALRDMSMEEITSPWKVMEFSDAVPAAPSPSEAPARKGQSAGAGSMKASAVAAAQVEHLGLNMDGEKVFAGVDGRFVKVASHTTMESVDQDLGRFLRAGDLNNGAPALLDCARGALQTLRDRQQLTLSDADRLATIWFGLPDGREPTLVERRFVIRAIETAISEEVRNLLFSQEGFDPSHLADANALFERRPTLPTSVTESERIKTREVPPAVSYVANRTFQDLPDGASIGIPFVASGLALSALDPKFSYLAIVDDRELAVGQSYPSPESFDGLVQFSKQQVLDSGIRSESLDGLVLNLPYSEAPKRVLDGVESSRADIQGAQTLLAGLREESRAVIMMRGDGSEYIGKAHGESVAFMRWLEKHYLVADAVEIDGSVFSQAGDVDSARLMVLGGRRLVPLKDEEITDRSEFEVMTTPEMLVAWAGTLNDQVSERVAGQSGNRVSDILAELSTEIRMNEFQSRYVPVSGLVDGDAMLPRYLQAPMRKGVAKLLADIPDVDNYVAAELQMSKEQLSRVFSAEQIDAVALAMWRNDRGLSFLTADQTGLGKGRILAALIRRELVHGRKVVFLTGKQTLFNDLWRDLVDIESANLVRPYSVNATASIVDAKGVTVATGNEKLNRQNIANKTWPAGANVMFCTYSQISTNKNRSDWLQRCVRGAQVILDESHNAAGDSKVSLRVIQMLAVAETVNYSSATWAKNATNLKLYNRLFPDVSATQLQEAVRMGGEPLQEILSSTLASDGGFCRREKDLSRLTVEVSQPTAPQLARNKRITDNFAQVLQAMGVITCELDEVINLKNDEIASKLAQATQGGKRTINVGTGISNTGFGSVLTNLCKQFLLAVNCDQVIEEAKRALKDNQKPLIALEFAGTSFYQEYREDLLQQERDRLEAAGEDPSKAKVLFDELPQFKDLLRLKAESLLNIKRKDSRGRIVRVDAADLYPKGRAAFKQAWEGLMIAIDQFPELPFAPIDRIRNELTDAGYSGIELSGRTYEVAKDPDSGRWTFDSIKKVDRRAQVAAFNSGVADYAIGTKAITEGFSLHASPKFDDTRCRVLIEAEVFRNVVDRVQMLGRVDRKDQVVSPVIRTINSGLPMEQRFLALSNAALRTMSANVTSSTRNSMELQDVTDVLNPIGDQVVQRYLEVNPGIIRQLGLTEYDCFGQELSRSTVESLARRVTGRLSMLPFADQERILGEIDQEYKSVIADLNATGKNPLTPRYHDIQAVEESRVLYSGSYKGHYDSEFEKPVELVELSYKEDIKPYQPEDVFNLIDRAKRWLVKDSRFDGEGFSRCASLLDDKRDELALEAANGDQNLLDLVRTTRQQREMARAQNTQFQLPKGWTVIHSLVDATELRLDFLTTALTTLELGDVVQAPRTDRVLLNMGHAVVVDIQPPLPGSEQNISLWAISLAMPGESQVHVFSLSDWFKGELSTLRKVDTFSEHCRAADKFEKYQPSQLTRHLLTLEGNLFQAAIDASHGNLGYPGVYTRADGTVERAILVRPSLTKYELLNKPVRVPSGQMARDYLVHGQTQKHPVRITGVTKSDKINSRNAILIQHVEKLAQAGDPKCWLVSVPPSKKAGAVYFQDQSLLNLLGAPNSTTSSRTWLVESSTLPAVVDQLLALGAQLQTEAGGRNWMKLYRDGRLTIPADKPQIQPQI